MATHKGSEGLVKIGANTVAELTGWSVTETMTPIDDSELSDTASTFLTDRTGWTGSIECHWDETDTTGQGAMTIGASVTLAMYPEGATTGDVYYTGTALITNIERSGASGDTVRASYSVQGTGALTESTV